MGRFQPKGKLWGLSDPAYKNASIHVGFNWFEIAPMKIASVYKSLASELVLAFTLMVN